MKKNLFLLLLLPLLAACTSHITHVEKGVDLSKYQHVYVEHRLADGHGVDQIIARELRGLGYDASSGPLTMLPDSAEIIVSYLDRWNFDFTDYLMGLDINVRAAHTDKPLANGTIYRPSITGGSPVPLVDSILGNFFPRKTAGTPGK